jgi:hypothetical protein
MLVFGKVNPEATWNHAGSRQRSRNAPPLIFGKAAANETAESGAADP